MINKEKWTETLPNINRETVNDKNQLNEDRWLKTISQKKKFSSVKSYSLISALFVCGLLTVSAIKNETRKLEKKINNLELSIETVKFNLDQEILDHEVITSPENITRLAKEYLNSDLLFYKKSQILSLNNEKFMNAFKSLLHDDTKNFNQLININTALKKISSDHPPYSIAAKRVYENLISFSKAT